MIVSAPFLTLLNIIMPIMIMAHPIQQNNEQLGPRFANDEIRLFARTGPQSTLPLFGGFGILGFGTSRSQDPTPQEIAEIHAALAQHHVDS